MVPFSLFSTLPHKEESKKKKWKTALSHHPTTRSIEKKKELRSDFFISFIPLSLVLCARVLDYIHDFELPLAFWCLGGGGGE